VVRALLIGPGAVGARAMRALIEADSVEEVVVAGGGDAHRAAVVDAGGGRASDGGAQADPDEHGDIDVVILCGPGGTHAAPARAHLVAGRSVVSCSDDVGDVRALLELDGLARTKGQRVVVGAGFSPGLTCLLVRHAARTFERVDEVHVARAGTGGPSCARQHHRALAGTAIDWREGSWQERSAGSGRELCWFPDPIGGLDCYRAELPDALLLTPHLVGVSRVTARLAASRRDRLTARLPMLRRPHPEGLVGAARVELRGARAGVQDVLVYGVLDRPAVATGAVAALAARYAVEERLPVGAAGLIALDDPTPALQELADVGIRAAVFEGGEHR
jgi:saccharopine dehydrogenase-like NADP-dependent oxidoreductase